MSSSEEVILDNLLPEFQKGLKLQDLKPYLKFACSLTDEECARLTESDISDGEAVQRLTALLKQKGSHCCARILLNALKQSINSPISSSKCSHMELIGKMERELNSTEKFKTSNGPYHLEEEDNIKYKETSDTILSSDVAFFPSAVPESPFTSTVTMQFGASASTHDPTQGQLNPLSWHSHFSKELQRPEQTSCNTYNPNMSVVISIGPSKEPVPLVRYKSLDESCKTEPNSDLILESKAIQKGFADFVLQVCNLLETSPGIDIEKVRLSLSYRNCDTDPALEIFSASSAVVQAKHIPGLLTALSRCTSWFNYELISNMAKEFCGEEGQRLVDGYEQLLKRFFQKLVFHCPPFANGDQKTLEGFETIEMKVDWNLQACVLQDVAIFKGTMCSLLELNPRFLVLKSVGEKEFQLSWAIPSVAVHRVLNNVSQKTEAFKKEKVDSVKVAENFVDFKTPTERLTSSPAAAQSSQTHTSITPTIRRESNFDIDTPDQALASPPPVPKHKQQTTSQVRPAFPPTLTKLDTTKTTTRSKLQSPMSPSSANPPKSAESASAFILPIVDETGAMIFAANEAKKRRTRRTNSKQGVRWQDKASDQTKQSQSSAVPPPPTQPPPSLPTSEEKKTKKLHQFRHFQSDSIIQAQPSSDKLASTVSRHSHCLNFDNKNAKVSVVTLPEPLAELTKQQRSPGILWRILGRANSTTPASIHIASIQASLTRSNSGELKVRKGQQLKALYRVGDRVFIETQLSKHGFIPYSHCRLSRKYYGPTSKLLQLSYSKLSPQGLDEGNQRDTNDKPIDMVTIKEHGALTIEELTVKSGDKLKVLYCDNSWVYAVREDLKAGILPRSACCFAQNSQQPSSSNTAKNPQPAANCTTNTQLQNSKQDSSQGSATPGDKVGKIVIVIRNFVPKSSTNAFTIRKGLRVKVIHESGQQLYVVTKSGVSFWIPTCYVRVTRKSSDGDGFLVNSFMQTSGPHSMPQSPSSYKPPLNAFDQSFSQSSILFHPSQQFLVMPQRNFHANQNYLQKMSATQSVL